MKALGYTVYLWALMASAWLCACLAYISWQRRRVPGAQALAAMLAAATLWTMGYVLELVAAGLEAKVMWAKIQYIGIAAAPLALLAFAAESSGMDLTALRRRRIHIYVCAPAVVTLLLVLTNEWHYLVWDRVGVQDAAAFSVLDLGHGPWFWVHALHGYFVLLVSSGLLLSTAIRSPRMYRTQAAVTLMAVSVPWLGNIAYVFHKNPIEPLDPTPLGFALSGLLLGWGLFRLGLLSHFLGIVPVARDRVVEDMPDAMIVLDQNGRVVDVNKSAAELVGLPAREIIGKPARDFALCEAGVQALCSTEEAGIARTEVSVGQGDGQRHFDLLASPLKDHGGRYRGRLAVLHDITVHKRAEKVLEQQVMYDGLTGLPNRNFLMKSLSTVTEGGSRSHALLLMDLDRFKEVNDTFGHRYGDVLLQHVGSRLREALRKGDFIARLGGDEFAVLLEGANERTAVDVAGRLLRSLNQPFKVEAYRLQIAASIGISLYPQHGDAANTLMRRADVAMYAAKRSKAGYTVYSAAADPYSPERLLLLGQLRSAIARGDLTFYYQPQVEMARGRVVRVEALARWRHPKLGLLLPAQFIPLAESSGVIRVLSLWAIKSALGQCRQWRDQGLRLPVSVNLSAQDLTDETMIAHIPRMLKKWSLEPACLEVEVTETALMQDPARSVRLLEDLAKMGVGVAVDDFGVAHSTLSYLTSLPVNAIKIDRSFVMGLTDATSNAAIVRSTINLGHELGLTVVAEGVETIEAYSLLGNMGCDIAQGHYLSLPLPAGDVAPWVSTWSPPSVAVTAGTRRRKVMGTGGRGPA